MNYKVMQRPMFRLGGSARKNYQTGTDLSDIEKLIEKRAGLRDKALGSMRTMLPFSVLASQMDDIRSIRKPGDILNILSNIGGSKELIGALTKLPSIDLKQTEGELSDKIALAKLRSSKDKKFEFQKRLGIAEAKREQAAKILGGKSFDQLSKEEKAAYNRLQTDINFLLRGTSLEDYLLSAKTKMGNLFDEDEERKFYNRIKNQLGQDQLAEGGRVGYQQGTPNPMVMPQPKPQEAVQDRQLDTLMDAAPALEDPNQAKSMGEKDMYNALRRRLPKEISDDVVRLIAYNQEAFADFANISDQSDVESFNQKYNVELVLPVGNQ